VTWSPNEFSVQPEETTNVPLAPHAYNITMDAGIKKFINDIVYSEFPEQ